jgi:polyhydroxyalkanoate synthesis regulator protein
MMKVPLPMKALEEQTKRNMEMFQNAIRLFSPFPPGGLTGVPATNEPAAEKAASTEKNDDLQLLKEQIAAMQKKIESMG